MFLYHVFSHANDANVRFLVATKSYWQKMTPLLRLVHTIKRKIMRKDNDLFPFSAFWTILWKTGNTGAEKLSRPGVIRYQTVFIRGAKPIEAHSMKIYGATKAHRISTNNILAS